MTGLSSSGFARSSTAIPGDYKRHSYTEISTSYRDSSTAPAGSKLSIRESIDDDLYLESSDYTLNDLRLRFRLFGLSILIQLTTLSDLSEFIYCDEIRDRIEREGGKDREVSREVKVKERGDDNNDR